MAGDLASGWAAAAGGGNTTILPFNLSEEGVSLRTGMTACLAKAERRGHVDFSVHI